MSQVKDKVSLPLVINVTGTVSYCHIAKKIEGDALVKENARRAKLGIAPADKPYYSLNIANPIVGTNPEKDPTGIATRYLQDQIKTQMKNNVSSTMYYGTSSSPFAPQISMADGRGIADNDHPLQDELANGSNVTVGIRFFQVQKGVGIGCGIDYVIINDPEPKFYKGGGSALAEALAATGVTYQPPQDEQNVAEAPAQPTAVPQPAPQPEVPVQNVTQPQAVDPMAGNPQQNYAQGPFNPQAMNPPQNAGQAPQQNVQPGIAYQPE